MQPLDSEVREVPPMAVSSAELVREAMSEAKELIRLEVALAKDEVRGEVVSARNAGIAFGVGAVVLLLGIALLLVALALAIFPGPIPSLVLGLLLVTSAGLAAVAGLKMLPKKPLAATRRRIETDVETMKERVQ
jgi:hypothetical protein